MPLNAFASQNTLTLLPVCCHHGTTTVCRRWPVLWATQKTQTPHSVLCIINPFACSLNHLQCCAICVIPENAVIRCDCVCVCVFYCLRCLWFYTRFAFIIAYESRSGNVVVLVVNEYVCATDEQSLASRVSYRGCTLAHPYRKSNTHTHTQVDTRDHNIRCSGICSRCGFDLVVYKQIYRCDTSTFI